jgi:aspartate aminotransferase-like enzyme
MKAGSPVATETPRMNAFSPPPRLLMGPGPSNVAPEVLAALEQLCPLDLSQDVFPAGAFTRTVMENMGAIILRTGDETFRLMSGSSSADSFLEVVEPLAGSPRK